VGGAPIEEGVFVRFDIEEEKLTQCSDREILAVDLPLIIRR